MLSPDYSMEAKMLRPTIVLKKKHTIRHGKKAEQVPKSVLFVCLGNVCLSSIAEAVFGEHVTNHNVSDAWRIDSPVTSTYEVGNPPDY